MSMTFYCPESPRTDAIGDDPNWSEFPRECNFANGNALDLLSMLDLMNEDDPYYGEWEACELPSIQRKIMKVLNVEGKRVHLVREPHELGRHYHTGNTDEQIIGRLRNLQRLVAYAAQRNLMIRYS